jgi:Putative zinc-finger
MTTHDSYTDRLSDYLDDELSASERSHVDAHLRECGECRTTLADLRAVAARAARLTDAAPATDLWPGVATRIGGKPGVLPFRLARRITFTLPQLVAASLALMVLSGGVVWLARLGGDRTDFPRVVAEVAPAVSPANFADAHFDDAIADLQQTLDAGRAKLDPETVRVLEANLAAIDRAIDQCRRALAADPANAYLNGHLAEAKRRKLALLRRATALAGS